MYIKYYLGELYTKWDVQFFLNGICFSCLKKGHTSKQCLQRLSCRKCKQCHPTSLCGDFENWKQKSSHLPREDSVSNGSSMKVSISNVTNLTTMIVSVCVSSEDSIEMLMVYSQNTDAYPTFPLFLQDW